MWAIDRCFLTYSVMVLAVSIGGMAVGGAHSASFRPWSFVALHACIGVMAVAMHRVCPGRGDAIGMPEGPSRLVLGVRTAVALVAVISAFMALAWLLPGVHAEPFEWVWIEADRRWFGADTSVALAGLPPWFVEILQWVYASFYLLPLAAALVAARCSGERAFFHVITLTAGGFLLSYLGYLLWPTLPPFRYFEYPQPIEGVWMAATIHAGIDAAEGFKVNCFPSGHTMMSVIACFGVVKYARRWAPAFFVVTALLVFSTVALRYHYSVDVLAGLVGAVLAWVLIGFARRGAGEFSLTS